MNSKYIFSNFFTNNLYFTKQIFKGFSGSYCTVQKEKCFKLIADSVKSLRTFLNELKNKKRLSAPKKLICALENFITKIKSKEHNLTVLNNDSKIKIFKDYKSYPDRIQKDKDNILLWQEKDSKSTSQGSICFRFCVNQ